MKKEDLLKFKEELNFSLNDAKSLAQKKLKEFKDDELFISFFGEARTLTLYSFSNELSSALKNLPLKESFDMSLLNSEEVSFDTLHQNVINVYKKFDKLSSKKPLASKVEKLISLICEEKAVGDDKRSFTTKDKNDEGKRIFLKLDKKYGDEGTYIHEFSHILSQKSSWKKNFNTIEFASVVGECLGANVLSKNSEHSANYLYNEYNMFCRTLPISSKFCYADCLLSQFAVNEKSLDDLEKEIDLDPFVAKRVATDLIYLKNMGDSKIKNEYLPTLFYNSIYLYPILCAMRANDIFNKDEEHGVKIYKNLIENQEKYTFKEILLKTGLKSKEDALNNAPMFLENSYNTLKAREENLLKERELNGKTR